MNAVVALTLIAVGQWSPPLRVDGPSVVAPGTLVTLEAVGTANKYAWFPTTPADVVYQQADRRCFFAAGCTPGRQYVFVLVAVDASNPGEPGIEITRHVVTVEGTAPDPLPPGPGPGPAPIPPGPTPTPTPPAFSTATGAKAFAEARLLPAATLAHAASVAAVFDAAAAQISAGTLRTEAAANDAVRSGLHDVLPADGAGWPPWLASVSSATTAEFNGQLSQLALIFREIATACQAVSPQQSLQPLRSPRWPDRSFLP